MVGGTIINGKYKHISTAFAACQQVTRFQVSKCDCISQHIVSAIFASHVFNLDIHVQSRHVRKQFHLERERKGGNY